MRVRGLALLGAVLMVSACGSGTGSASLETDDQKASYGIGLDMGRNLEPAAEHLDMDALVRGIEDALAGRDPAVEQAEIQRVLQAFSERVQEEQTAAREAEAEENEAAGQAFRDENAAEEGVTVTESGLQYEVLEEGDGSRPTEGDQVSIHYVGTLVDGTEFDSSRARGQPAVFEVGGVIAGFSEALQLIPVGSTYRVVMPPDLAYGAQGAGGNIGPNATLIFEIELLGIEG